MYIYIYNVYIDIQKYTKIMQVNGLENGHGYLPSLSLKNNNKRPLCILYIDNNR